MATLTQTKKATFTTSESRRNSIQQIGGLSGIVAGLTFIFGFAMFVTVFEPLASGTLSPTETVEFLRDNQSLYYIWNLVIYVLFGLVQAGLTLGLYDRLKGERPATAQIAATVGLIWSGLVIASGMVANVGASAVIEMYVADATQAGTVWAAISSVYNGLGGGNEIVGGLWVALVSWIGFRGVLPKALNGFGMIVGLAGIVTLVPMLSDVGAIFGLGIIVWYIWVGIVLLRNQS